MLSEKLWVFMEVVEDVWTQKSQDHRAERGFASELIDVADSLSFAMSRYIQIIPTLLWGQPYCRFRNHLAATTETFHHRFHDVPRWRFGSAFEQHDLPELVENRHGVPLQHLGIGLM